MSRISLLSEEQQSEEEEEVGDEVEEEKVCESSNHGDKEESIGSFMDTGRYLSPQKRSIA